MEEKIIRPAVSKGKRLLFVRAAVELRLELFNCSKQKECVSFQWKIKGSFEPYSNPNIDGCRVPIPKGCHDCKTDERVGNIIPKGWHDSGN
jgi:hypothetical protein